MITVVAFATDQRKVADWPRSTVLGSIVNAVMVGRPSAPVPVFVLPPVVDGGAGGGASGAFFPHPTLSTAITTIALSTPGDLIFDIKKPPRLL
jgi:hypothetical protein